MSEYQKWVAQIIFTTLLTIAWLAMIFMVALGYIDSVNGELQGLAIAAITALLGITSGALPALGKRVGKIFKD